MTVKRTIILVGMMGIFMFTGCGGTAMDPLPTNPPQYEYTQPPSEPANFQSEPVTVAENGRLADMGMGIVDIHFSSIPGEGGARYWFHSEHFGTVYRKFRGTVDDPCQTLIWEKTASELFPETYRTNSDSGVNTLMQSRNGEHMITQVGGVWIAGLYQEPGNPENLLAFLHIEEGGADSMKGRVALAWSEDSGDTFKYLGDIAAPSGDPSGSEAEPRTYNIIGVPYIIRDGYFYIYYQEPGGIGAASAKVSDVIEKAKEVGGDCSIMPEWRKWNGEASGAETWVEPGMGGKSAPVELPWGICHVSACYSSLTGKYYMPLTSQNWAGGDTWVRLFESADGLHWSETACIVRNRAETIPIIGWGAAGNTHLQSERTGTHMTSEANSTFFAPTDHMTSGNVR